MTRPAAGSHPSRAGGAPLAGVVLVGGRSVRMGTPKALLRLGGEAFLDRVVAALRPHVAEVLLAGDGPVTPAAAALRRLPDAAGVPGPLGGLLAAAREGLPFLAASCDAPFFTSEAVRWLLSERRPGAAAVLPLRDGRPEPLLAVYEPASLLLLESLAAAGTFAPRLLAAEPSVHTPEVPVVLYGAFRSVDTPADLEACGHPPSAPG